MDPIESITDVLSGKSSDEINGILAGVVAAIYKAAVPAEHRSNTLRDLFDAMRDAVDALSQDKPTKPRTRADPPFRL